MLTPSILLDFKPPAHHARFIPIKPASHYTTNPPRQAKPKHLFLHQNSKFRRQLTSVQFLTNDYYYASIVEKINNWGVGKISCLQAIFDNNHCQIYNLHMSTEKPKQNQPHKHAFKSRVISKARRAAIINACLDGKDVKKVAIETGLSEKSAGTQVCQILSEPKVRRTFVQILEEQGLTDDILARKAQELLDAENTHYFAKDGVVTDSRKSPANETRRKTLEMIARFKGHLKDNTATDVSIGLMQMVVNVTSDQK